MTDDGRTRHYGHFYGLDPLPENDGRPLVVAWGNCQAEALRLLLDTGPADPDSPVRSVRVPPVHEITATDLRHLRRLLAGADVLLAQPVTNGYRELPLGTRQVGALLPRSARIVRWPVLFDAAPYPFQVLARVPGAGDPPLVPYHDLRTLVQAHTGRRPRTPSAPEPYRELAERSRQALAAREEAHGTVRVSQALANRAPDGFHTINHPGNPVLVAAALAVQRELGLPQAAADPGRILLSSVLTPHEPEVFAALGLPPGEGRDRWVLAGEPVDDGQVREAHLEFYRRNPAFVTEGLRRHADTLATLGLS